MDFETVEQIVKGESGETLIYVAVGCALGRYPPGEHPKQQYPPYLDQIDCPKLCILIDPVLEMPPRATTDVKDKQVKFLPILHMFEYNSPFLHNLIEHCCTKQIKMILHDFSGTDSTQYYPVQYGTRLFKHVLFDPTYGNGDCFPDVSAIKILRDSNGDFIQPKYCTFRNIQNTHVFASEFKARMYPIVHLIGRMYRIHRGFEEVRDWCTDESIRSHYERLRIIYDIRDDDYLASLRKILTEVVQDLCVVADSFLTEEEITTIVNSPKGLETMWRTIGAILFTN